MVFSEKDIIGATDNFSECNKLGSGGFGVVYRGWINGTTVAVKQLTEVPIIM
jgi:predicted Ser/Thr protein kinase